MNTQTNPFAPRKKEVAAGTVRQLGFGDILRDFGLKNDLFYVLDSGEIRFSFSLLRPFKTNDFWLLYLDRGTLTVKLNVTTYPLQQGSLLIKPADAIFQVQHFSADCHFQLFGFTETLVTASGMAKKHLQAFAFLRSQNIPVLPLPAEQENALLPLFKLLRQKSRQQQKGLYYDEAIYHAFALLAFEVATLYSREQNHLPELRRREHLALQFMQLLPQHCKQERSVYFYAAQLNVTPKHLSKCVKEVIGKTCGELIDEAVILEAKILLDNPDLSVAGVAEELHFSDQFFFSKYFKKHTAVSPTVYRKGL